MFIFIVTRTYLAKHAQQQKGLHPRFLGNMPHCKIQCDTKQSCIHMKRNLHRDICVYVLQKRHVFFMNIDLDKLEKIPTEENEIFGQYTALKNTTCYNKDLNTHDNKTDRQTNEYRPIYTRT